MANVILDGTVKYLVRLDERLLWESCRLVARYQPCSYLVEFWKAGWRNRLLQRQERAGVNRGILMNNLTLEKGLLFAATRGGCFHLATYLEVFSRGHAKPGTVNWKDASAG